MSTRRYSRYWRETVLALTCLGSLALVACLPAIPQPLGYHEFQDMRAILGIPNFFNVATNLVFLLVGVMGLQLCRRREINAVRSWTVLFVAVLLVAFGSAYYHWQPRNPALVWDRLPMAIGFMALLSALLAECVSVKLERWAMPALCALGVAAVAYWHLTDDLRPYVWVQFFPLLTIVLLLLLFREKLQRPVYLLLALACYAFAKLAEMQDAQIYSLTNQQFSGHSLKHLLAALGMFVLYRMLAATPPVRTARSGRPRAAAV